MAAKLWITALTLVCVWIYSKASTYYGHEPNFPTPNLLVNGEFDEAPKSGLAQFESGWYALMSSETMYGITNQGCYSGDSCAFAVSRTADWMGLHGRVDRSLLEPDTRYWLSMFVKYDIPAGMPNFRITAILKYHKTAGGDDYYGLWSQTYDYGWDQWTYIGTDFKTPDQATLDGMDWLEVYIDSPMATNYWLDATSLTKVADPNWQATAQANIEQYRKGDFNLGIDLGPEFDPSKVSVVINQTKSAFPFGSMVYGQVISDQIGVPADNEKYRNYFLPRFDWLVFNHISKWRQMETYYKIQDDSKFQIVDPAVDWALAHGKKLRGHCELWNTGEFSPDWFDDITDKDTAKAEVLRRIDYMTEHYKNKFVHYDVSNEHGGSSYLETKTGDNNILVEMFERTRQGDPTALRFTNHFEMISGTLVTAKSLNNVRYLVQKGNIVDAVGIQGHFDASTDVNDIEAIKRRMEVVKSAGKPLWITELDSTLADINVKKDFIGGLLLLFFGTPEVDGILFWGLEQLMDDNYESNALGQVVDNLLLNEWRTNFVVNPTTDNYRESRRVFYGDYTYKAYYDGALRSQGSFAVEKGSPADLNILYGTANVA